MPIQIIDNFSLNTAKPLDNRLVVGGSSFYSTKDDIPVDYRYEGLRLWDLNDSKPYIWDSTSWVEEVSGFSGTGIANRVTYFLDSETLESSDMRYDSTTTNFGLGINPDSTYKLKINGSLSANSFYGNGNNLNNLDASNISSGTLDSNLLKEGTPSVYDRILLWKDIDSGSPYADQVFWENTDDVVIGKSDKIKIGNTDLNTHYLTMVDSTGGYLDLKVKSNVYYKPTSNKLSLLNLELRTSGSTGLVTLKGPGTNKNFDVTFPSSAINQSVLYTELDQTIASTKTFTSVQLFESNVTIGSSNTNYSITTTSTNNILSQGYEGAAVNTNQGEWVAQGIEGASIESKLFVEGYIKAAGIWFTSDQRKKNEVLRPDNSTLLNKVLQLEPVLYQWKDNQVTEMGLFAQEVEKVIPEAVSKVSSNEFEDGELNINYQVVFTHLIGAIKEQNRRIEELEKKIN